jgi:alpha-glucosidase (family GH31 glycosyl hydrolase)
MQYHSEYNAHRQPSIDRTPWNIQARTGDPRVISVFKQFVDVRTRLLPYIWQEAQYTAATGQPLMRATQLTYANASCYDYMFGRDLLVSPVVEPDVDSWTVALPSGEWRDFWTHELYAGGQPVVVHVPLDRIPVFLRAGATLPLE